ncbi:MAG: maleylpyruvate isomerase family mycothiol-dependent enzyme [Propionibacteriaceae bacterium]|nr:maleylpyruvate isomerase family mycothiol-dependent enzyme [Propionibacteriaceae bacterium]
MTPRRTLIWTAVHRERQALAEDLQGLGADRWATASLCPGWDVHDVVAHLVDTAHTTKLGFLRGMVAAGFDFDKDNANGVARRRRDDPNGTLADLRAAISRTTGPPAPLASRLVEMFVHGEDIRRPLGVSRDYPCEHVVTALKSQLGTSTKMGGGRGLVEGLRLVATDTDFQHGEGAEVRGSAIALLLAVSGRPVRENELEGPGAAGLGNSL